MTTATLRISAPLPEARTEPRKGMLARFFDAMAAARMRQAMRELERHRHLIPPHLLKSAGYEATASDDSKLPFTR
jgi:hypothetical protein